MNSLLYDTLIIALIAILIGFICYLIYVSVTVLKNINNILNGASVEIDSILKSLNVIVDSVESSVKMGEDNLTKLKEIISTLSSISSIFYMQSKRKSIKGVMLLYSLINYLRKKK